eukprot:m.40398 g.40398  ORF g.40398 m.40398 type:complete len:83 (+) comp11711_c1_seq1:219-467(+)
MANSASKTSMTELAFVEDVETLSSSADAIGMKQSSKQATAATNTQAMMMMTKGDEANAPHIPTNAGDLRSELYYWDSAHHFI